MDKKIIIIIVLVTFILVTILYSTKIISLNIEKKSGAVTGNYENIPQECRSPEGQDIQRWKEHLWHHENTKFCLQYFN